MTGPDPDHVALLSRIKHLAMKTVDGQWTGPDIDATTIDDGRPLTDEERALFWTCTADEFRAALPALRANASMAAARQDWADELHELTTRHVSDRGFGTVGDALDAMPASVAERVAELTAALSDGGAR